MMKRSYAALLLLTLGLVAASASVWEGSAIIGQATDFNGEGLLGICNSFPLNTRVEVRNLDNGRSVTVLISGTINNPGIFMALSPMAASRIDLKPGEAVRIRASALGDSRVISTLPPARAGETSDPDYNPSILAAREPPPQPLPPAADWPSSFMPQHSEPPPQPLPPAADWPSSFMPQQSQPPPQPLPPAATFSEPGTMAGLTEIPAAVFAETPPPAPEAEPPRTQPSLVVLEAETPKKIEEPKPIAKPVEPEPPSQALIAASESELQAELPRKPEAEDLPPQRLAADGPGTPKPVAIETSLPEADPAPIPKAETKPAFRNPPSLVPELEGGRRPLMRKQNFDEAYLAEPGLPRTAAIAAEPETTQALAASQTAPPRSPEEQSQAPNADAAPEVYGLPQPKGLSGDTRVALAEPLEPEFQPEELPEELLRRLQSPSPRLPDIALDDVEPKTPLLASSGQASFGEPAAAEQSSASPEALALDSPRTESPADDSTKPGLGEPQAPRPSETIAAERPSLREGDAPRQTQLALAEPGSADGSPAAEEPAPASEAAQAARAQAAAKSQASPLAEALALEARPASTAVSTLGASASAAPEPAALKQGFFYVQVGVFSDRAAVDSMSARLASRYPLTIDTIETAIGQTMYRLFVGPLSRDESGTELFRLRSQGFKDAFVRQGR